MTSISFLNVGLQRFRFHNHGDLIVKCLKALKRRDCDRHDVGSKPTQAILLCPQKKHFYGTSFA